MFKNLLKIFRRQTAEDIARQNLHQYQCALLRHQCDAAWNTKMAEFYRDGIQRMAAFTPVQIPENQLNIGLNEIR